MVLPESCWPRAVRSWLCFVNISICFFVCSENSSINAVGSFVNVRCRASCVSRIETTDDRRLAAERYSPMLVRDRITSAANGRVQAGCRASLLTSASTATPIFATPQTVSDDNKDRFHRVPDAVSSSVFSIMPARAVYHLDYVGHQ
jgi:hypothetical protein